MNFSEGMVVYKRVRKVAQADFDELEVLEQCESTTGQWEYHRVM